MTLKTTTRPTTAPTSPAGHLINRPEGLEGAPGIGYNYIVAENGIFIQAENDHLAATILIQTLQIRGLAPLQESFQMKHNTIPNSLVAQGINWMRERPMQERFFAITWQDNRYQLNIPPQDGATSSLTYTCPENPVAEFHSHGPHPAQFSQTDNLDEQSLRIYGVVSNLADPVPQVNIRMGVYGYFKPIKANLELQPNYKPTTIPPEQTAPPQNHRQEPY